VVKVEDSSVWKPHTGYRRYIERIRTLSPENPYLPRIYSTETIEDPQDPRRETAMTVYTMERLSEPERLLDRGHISRDFIMNLVDNTVELTAAQRKNLEDESEYIIWNFFARILDHAMNSQDYSAIKDGKLKSAMKIIAELTGIQTRLDIHGGNIMVRLTSVGPQLVISDPLI
jgi:hypothetical protein